MASTDGISNERAELESCPLRHNGRHVASYNLAEVHYSRFKEGKLGGIDEAISLLRHALELCPSGHPDQSFLLHLLAFYLSARFDDQGVVADLEEAVSLGRAALELRPPGHPHRGVSLNNLADYLRKRFQKLAVMHDLEEAIELHRAVLELQPSGHPDRSSSLHFLALCLLNRYNNQGIVTDLEEAVILRRAALELYPPGHPLHGISLNNLADYLYRRFQKHALMHDLEKAIELHHAALEQRPSGHPDRSSSLHSLALCLSERYDNQGVVADLEEAVTLGRAALELYPPGHVNRGASLYNLGDYLRKRFWKHALTHDLEEAIELHRAALELRPSGHSDRPSSLHSLALCLSDMHDTQGGVAYLKEAVTLGRAALELCPPGHPDRWVSLHTLANFLWKKFRKHAGIHDLAKAIELNRAALEQCPSGHPNRSSLLYDLALYLSNRYDNQGIVADLEEAVALGHAALELCPPGHPRRSIYLYNLTYDLWTRFQKQTMVPALGSRPVLARHRRSSADVASLLHALSQYLWERFRERATVADLDEAISLTTYVLELRLPGHPDYTISHEQLALFVGERVRQLERGSSLDRPVTLGRAVDNLRVLANYFRTSYRNQHATVDLNEAIKLYRYILQFYLISHPDRASSLHDLALCLADLFRHQHVAADLDEAIVLEQEALQLLIPDDPGYNISLYNLTACLHMKISPQVVTTSSHPPGVIHFDIEQVIRHFTFETLKTMPTRLLHTPTGVLCNRDVQISHFMRSQQCRQLLSSCKARTADQQIECIRTALSRYFQFVTLSHHWGEGEPLLRDVEGQSIYGMSTKMGFGKLQAFCVTACGRGYLWAWSDTCCIDKDSSAELQEAIGSMFSWYRRSALTIVYLSDVPDTSSFGSSKWFGRGWTLQELLAPSTVLFYTQNWSLYKNFTCRNHKTNVAVLEELERATGIEARFLTNFSPGMDDARSRLQWASSRRTTRPEDIAYSLFGIFDLHLPVLYGESTGKALGRLLAEIISQSGDISILDWIGEASSFHSCFPAHITSYQTLPLQPNAEHPLTISPASFPALRRLYRSLDKSPFPQFINRRLILPCITHRVTAVQVKGGDPSSPSYAYKIQASGLRPLEILLPDKLGDAAMEPSALQLIRPWHLKLLGPSGKLDATTEKQLLFTLRRPFSALLLIQLPHNEYKRIASSTPITAQLLDSVSILQSKIRTLTIV